MNRLRPMSLLSFAALSICGLLSLACLDEGPVLKPKDAESSQEQTLECKEVLGKAFASVEERQWFVDNCSTWPERDVPAQAQASNLAPQPADTPECAAMRGKPYESQAQRQWFLANCVNGAAARTGDTASAGGDRQDCNQIRGTPYRSQAERQWYLTNCQMPVAQPNTDSNNDERTDRRDDDGPDRRDGNENRGGRGRN